MNRAILFSLALAGAIAACATPGEDPATAEATPTPGDHANGKDLRAIPISAGSAQAGTTLSATITAAGFDERTITYDWALTKTANPTSLDLAANQTGTVTFTLDATRTQVSDVTVTGVRGEVCVTNGGSVATSNLEIVNQVECKTGPGAPQPVSGASQTVTPQTQLAPGETECYPYDISPFSFPAGVSSCRVASQVTITNHSAHLGAPFGPEPKADFTIPNVATILEIDASATVTDKEDAPAGFTCLSISGAPFTFAGTSTVNYTTTIQNVSAPCNLQATFTNTATLTEVDTPLPQRIATALVSLSTGACPTGCTRNIGFWKTHAGFTGNNPDLVTPLLPISLGTPGGATSVLVTTATQAVAILTNSSAANAINKLYSRLLAAKLNIASGASSAAVASTITAADAFLATHNAASWSSLSAAQKQQVTLWTAALDDYDAGLIGPGACPQ